MSLIQCGFVLESFLRIESCPINKLYMRRQGRYTLRAELLVLRHGHWIDELDRMRW
jgi:hypothetical protein